MFHDTATHERSEHSELLDKLIGDLSPPEKFVLAVGQFATAMELPHDEIVAGQPFQFGGLVFAIDHYGWMDRGGAYVVVDYGDMPEGEELLAMRQMLEHNRHNPAALTGYFSMQRGGNRMQYISRVDLEADHDAALVITEVVAASVASIHNVIQAVQKRIDEAQGVPAPGFDQMG